MQWIVICLLFGYAGLYSQSLELVDVDASAYPVMRARFLAMDARGIQQTPDVSSVAVTENGKQRTVTAVVCSTDVPVAVSSVLVVDVSASMKVGQAITPNIDLAKTAARAWVNGLPLGRSECSIVSFDEANYLNQDFTRDRAILLSAIESLAPKGATSYDAALYLPAAGGLIVSDRGKHKRVIVMLTDGLPNEIPNVTSIIAEAKRQNCAIYAVTLGMRAPASLVNIAKSTGGQVFENVTSIADAEQVYRTVLQQVQGGKPCTVEWQTQASCREKQSAEVAVELKWQGLSSVERYLPPGDAFATLEFSPPSFRFSNPPVGTSVSQPVKITARGSGITVNGVRPSNPAFSLSPSSFSLQMGQSTTLLLTYTAADSGYAQCQFEFDSDPCPAQYFASGRHFGRRERSRTLKVIRPNGGESFVVGSDTTIAWEGVPANDLVTIEFSADSGKSWRRIDTARGLSYRWKDIPGPVSTNCFVRVVQFDDSVALGRCIRTITGHTFEVFSIAFSPINQILASGGDDMMIRLMDVGTGKEVRAWQAHGEGIRSVTYSPDGKMLASGSLDKSIKLWDPFTGQIIRTLTGHSDRVQSLSFSPDGKTIASASYDRTIKLWDVATGQEIKTLANHTSAVMSTVWSADGRFIYSSGQDRTIRSWDVSSAQELRTIIGHSAPIWTLALSPDGRTLASGSDDNTIKHWDVATGQLIQTLTGHKNGVLSLAYNPYGGTMASGSYGDNSIKLWSEATGEEIMTLYGHTDRISCVTFSKDGRLLGSGSFDNTIKLWSTGGQEIQTDTSDMTFSIVKPVTRVKSVDMRDCVLGQTKDSVVTDMIVNVGAYPFKVVDVYFEGADASAFSLVSGSPGYSILAGATQFAEVRFRPARLGIHQARIVVVTQSDTLRQPIFGTGVSSQLTIANRLIDFGRVAIGTRKDTTQVATVRNAGTTPVTIASVRQGGPNDQDFVTIAGDGSFTLQPGEVRLMDLGFTANSIGRTSGTLEFSFNGIGSPAVVQLFADAFNPVKDTTSVTVVVPRYNANAGKAFTLDVTMSNSRNFDDVNAPRAFTATIGVNPTVLYLTDPLLACTPIDSGSCHVVVSGVRGDSDTLLKVPVVATIGTTDYSPIELVRFQWLDTTFVNLVTLQDGSIRVTDVCDEGGVRLYVPSDARYSLSSRPNPVASDVDLQYGLAGSGPVTIEILDRAGRLMQTAVNEQNLASGMYVKSIDVSALANGPYIIVLRSRTSVLHSRMDVVR